MKRSLLSDIYSSLSRQWHPTKNGSLKASNFAPQSHKKAWWRHKHRKTGQWHEWRASINKRTIRNQGCPYCSNQKVLIGFNDLKTKHPNIARQWHPTKNGTLKPKNVVSGSGKKIWWRHKHVGTQTWHEWNASILSRVGLESGCPYCANKKILIGFNDFGSRYPELALQWHPTKNRSLSAQQVVSQTHKKVWWRHKHEETQKWHTWEASVKSRVGAKSGCPYCSNKKVLVGFNDFKSQHPTLSKEWHPTKNGRLLAKDVVSQSHKKVWWRHKDTTTNEWHEWKANLNNRVAGTTGCPKCSKHGFDSTKSATLYVISKGQIIQFGITNSLPSRLASHKRIGFNTVEPIKLIQFNMGNKAKELEVSLMNLMKEYEVPSCSKIGIKFDGSTEAFQIENTNEEFLEDFKDLIKL